MRLYLRQSVILVNAVQLFESTRLDPFNPKRKLRVCDLNFIHRWVSYIDYAEQSGSLKGCEEPHTSTIRAQ